MNQDEQHAAPASEPQPTAREIAYLRSRMFDPAFVRMYRCKYSAQVLRAAIPDLQLHDDDDEEASPYDGPTISAF